MADHERSDTLDPNAAPSDSTEGDRRQGAAAESGSPEELRRQLAELQAKAEENWNKYVRVQAELENLRKRSQRELENAHKYAVERFATELLPVRDSLELGLTHSQEEAEAKKLHEGMELTLKMVDQLMDRLNIKEINPQGQPFNPEYHQAMSTQENAEVPPNTVIAVMQKGYTLNDRLLRPALVIVSKAPESDQG